MKRPIFTLGLALALLFGVRGAYAQSDPLAGSWGMSASGQAALGDPSSGNCSVNGTVPASLYDVLMQFSHGSIIVRNLGINIGATNCPSVNFQGSGTYTVLDKGNGSFEASGKFTSAFAGRGAACSATGLTDVAFTIIGKTGDSTFTITIDGLGSGSYAEGPPAGPLTCAAPVLNLTGTGAGKKF